MATLPVRLDAWFREEMPELNRAVLGGTAPRTAVADAMSIILPDLPSPTRLTPRVAQELVIGMGLAGSSVARHYQENDADHKQHPEHAFDGLAAGPEMLPFRTYFAALAERTGTGHYGRDAYASLVIWNVPTIAVHFGGAVLATLSGTTDGVILSYTGDPAEQWFFELVKRGQTLELGVNTVLEPLVEGEVGLTSDEGLHRVRQATTLLEALRRLFLEFADARHGAGMQPQYFMDVFRQFAAHWVPGDIPPSGALDVDALKRDFLLGTTHESYVRHVQRIMPALLARERSELQHCMDRPSMPDRLLAAVGLDRAGLAELSPYQLEALAGTHPAVADWHRLLSSHARAAGAHLMLSKRFLFNPQRRRDSEGIGDRQLVSNRRGTTGLDESILDRLTRMRREHPLAPLRRTSAQLARAAGPLPVAKVSLQPGPFVRADGTGPAAVPAAADRLVEVRVGNG
ncbi:hypothetical protein [Jidongwangia harbinensis]|uniref:hypothetical protein n=1 Tax=Jidongwangia harbinensis TaxID=2878561 RepID=UPI001CD9ADB9|nr:hypothetical protein [Jidongwangia harbinensis]MCA2216231.1 hypothetical protein [Jidongwangia harbinensis]